MGRRGYVEVDLGWAVRWVGWVGVMGRWVGSGALPPPGLELLHEGGEYSHVRVELDLGG